MYIIKRIAKTAELGDEFGGKEAFGRDMLCPECGGNNLHMGNIEQLNADNLKISFWCEHCGEHLPHLLELRFHKGSTMIRWFVPDLVALVTDRLTS